MIKADALGYIRRGFQEEGDEPRPGRRPWSNAFNQYTYEELLRQLVDDHGISPMTAVDILETAYDAAATEFGAESIAAFTEFIT
jgi:hypothetical protein